MLESWRVEEELGDPDSRGRIFTEGCPKAWNEGLVLGDKSLATLIPHRTGLDSIPYIDRKFLFHRGFNQYQC